MAGELLGANGDVQIGTGSTLTRTVLCTKATAFGDPSTGSPYANVWVGNNFNPNSGFELITQDIQRIGQPGVFSGADTPTVRRVEFDVWVNATSTSQLTNAITALSNATAPLSTGEAELAFQVNGSKYVLYGRYRGVENTSPEMYRTATNMRRVQRWRIRFLATDPFIYSTTSTVIYPQQVSTSVTFDRGAPPFIASPTAFTANVSHTVAGQAQPRWQMSIPAGHRNPLVNSSATGGSINIRFERGMYWVDENSGTQSRAFVARSWDRVSTNTMGRYTGAGSTWPVLVPGETRFWYYSYNTPIYNDGLTASSAPGTAMQLSYWPAYYMVAI